MPRRSPSAWFTAWPSAMPTSSTVWCWSTSRSPSAFTARSNAPWRATRSSMWSRKRTPVRLSKRPRPSSVSATLTCVSAVLRSISALRTAPPAAAMALLACARRRRWCTRKQLAQPGSLLRSRTSTPPRDHAARRAPGARSPPSHQHEVRLALPVPQAQAESSACVEQRLRLARLRDVPRHELGVGQRRPHRRHGHRVEVEERHHEADRRRAARGGATSTPTRMPARPWAFENVRPMSTLGYSRARCRKCTPWKS